MNVEPLTRRLMRLRKVADHIDSHLDDELRLEELADIAHLSRFHFLRVFAEYAGEAPLARVRRLRLLRARARVLSGDAPSMFELAMDAGYNSAAAFSRAFSALYGVAPSRVQATGDESAGDLRIEHLPALAIQYIPYQGETGQSLRPFDELRARALSAGIPREQRKGWAIHLDGAPEAPAGQLSGQVSIRAALLSERLGTDIPGLDHGTLPTGQYAVFSLRGGYDAPPRAELARRIAAETGWQMQDGLFLRCFQNAAYLPANSEKRCELYVPVARA